MGCMQSPSKAACLCTDLRLLIVCVVNVGEFWGWVLISQWLRGLCSKSTHMESEGVQIALYLSVQV